VIAVTTRRSASRICFWINHAAGINVRQIRAKSGWLHAVDRGGSKRFPEFAEIHDC